ncbi:hypothetical protein BCR33DRAFT_719566 [Rhizoclosmatium globosum]|uniref:SET domain-containing protein n=1 Tax=Rhizoclosmatium globosum TaxID=329046 RepID=A0A1Y2BZH6_9FUNG|nr:hypothetical protein BCR33DRAFT_719566 [Rhizoclosmatium globosum]|eukprot:ORY40182.1 hypothetical protein BCR33DRAFT_719566 [Rhizoclosmatium globosum]
MVLIVHPSIEVRAIPHKGLGFICVAPEGIAADTMLLRETALEAWSPPANPYNASTTAAKLAFRIRNDASETVTPLIQNLFPKSLDLIDHSDLSKCSDAAQEEMLQLVMDWELESGCNLKPGWSPVLKEELVRLWFVVECNSFPTGFLTTLSYANHSCNPNCTVFEEDGTTTNDDDDGDDDDASDSDAEEQSPNPIYSMWTKRDIPHGHEITISYLDMTTQIQMAAARQQRLRSKFLFDCKCDLCNVETPRIGLLKDTGSIDPETGEMRKLYSPRNEDFTCAAFYTVAGCTGAVGRWTGVCNTCNTEYNKTQWEYVSRGTSALIQKMRKQLGDANDIIKAGGNGDEFVAELTKHKAELEESKIEADKLLHSSHLAYGPLQTCLDKLGSLIRREEYKKKRQQAK